jgi:hypothetical protein
MKTTDRAALGLASALAAAAALAPALAHCSAGDAATGSDAQGAGSDVAPPPRRDAAADGGGEASSCDAPVNDDGGLVSDWPGWRRLTEVCPCCPVDVALNPSASLPKLSWQPCSNGAAKCQELVHSWQTDVPLYFVSYTQVSHDTTGGPRLLKFTRSLSGSVFEDDLYDFASLAPLGGCRADDTPPIHGDVVIRVGPSTATAFATIREGDDAGLFLAHGPPSQVLSAPSFLWVADQQEALSIQEMFASDTAMAWDAPLGGVLGRVAAGATPYQPQANGHPAMLFEAMEGDYAFAYSEHGTTGWWQEYVMGPDAKIVLYRDRPGRDVVAFRTDGSTMFWSEVYGSPNPGGAQPNMEVWSAPYTADPARLATTARQVATVANPYFPLDAAAFSGLYAVVSSPTTCVVVRGSDGAQQTVVAGGNWVFTRVVAVTPSEVWATMSIGPNGPAEIALARYALGPW